MLSEDDLTKFLEDNREAVLQASRDAIIAKLTASMNYQLPDVMHDQVRTFMENEIAPEIGKMLTDQKGAILAAATKAASEIGDGLAKALTLRAATTLSKSYDVKDIIKVLFDAKY